MPTLSTILLAPLRFLALFRHPVYYQISERERWKRRHLIPPLSRNTAQDENALDYLDSVSSTCMSHPAPAPQRLIDPSPVPLTIEAATRALTPTTTAYVHYQPTTVIPISLQTTHSLQTPHMDDTTSLAGFAVIAAAIILCLGAVLLPSALAKLFLSPTREFNHHRSRSLNGRASHRSSHMTTRRFETQDSQVTLVRENRSMDASITTPTVMRIHFAVRDAATSFLEYHGAQVLVTILVVIDAAFQFLTNRLAESSIVFEIIVIAIEVLLPVLWIAVLLVLRALAVFTFVFGSYVWSNITQPRNPTGLSANDGDGSWTASGSVSQQLDEGHVQMMGSFADRNSGASDARIGAGLAVLLHVEDHADSNVEEIVEAHDDHIVPAAPLAIRLPPSWPVWFLNMSRPTRITSSTILTSPEILGSGTFGTVSVARQVSSGTAVAIKRIAIGSFEANELDLVYNELETWNRLNGSPMFPSLFGMWTEGPDVIFVMNYYRNGDIDDLMIHGPYGGSLPRDLAIFYTAELILATQYMHQHGIVHGDLKPENLLIDNDGHLVVTDFGGSHPFNMDLNPRAYPTWAALQEHGGDDFPMLWPSLLNPHGVAMAVGTTCFLAPEVAAVCAGGNVPFSFGIDYWAVGIIAHEFVTGFTPHAVVFTAEGEYREVKPLVVDLDQKDFHVRKMTTAGQDFVRRLLQEVPEDRASVSEIKSHGYLRTIDWVKLANREIPVPRRWP